MRNTMTFVAMLLAITVLFATQGETFAAQKFPLLHTALEKLEAAKREDVGDKRLELLNAAMDELKASKSSKGRSSTGPVYYIKKAIKKNEPAYKKKCDYYVDYAIKDLKKIIKNFDPQ